MCRAPFVSAGLIFGGKACNPGLLFVYAAIISYLCTLIEIGVMAAQVHNNEMNLAWQFVEGTDVSVFLTGRAGTGKTTFLRKLKELSPKRMVVVAPTGVAAINARGVTIHSFFQLSPGIHLPGKEETPTGKQRFYQMSKDKKNVLRTMDLLVIDEISMVRCDLLDAIDGVLRKYRDRNRPFGGVQLLLIGDLQQLAPVATDEEWRMLSPYYETPYFFGSRALSQIEYVTVELQHVYRQQDEQFINILSAVRENRITPDVQERLNARYVPGFVPPDGEGWIRLTTHNRRAQEYNEEQLRSIRMPVMFYKAEVKGNFPEISYPADVMLQLKVGSQVMFLKNDPNGDKYYNGKIGVVTALAPEHISVLCAGEDRPITVPQLEWENTKYVIDPATQEIREEVDGTFRQYPLRLAWAITVHKSQGLTFDHAVLDINRSFAHGQVYVALSRCRTLEGLVLSAPLQFSSVITDGNVEDFIVRELEEARRSAGKLGEMRYRYFCQLLIELFNMNRLLGDLSYVTRVVDEHLYLQQPDYLSVLKASRDRFAREVMPVVEKFRSQYGAILENVRQGERPEAYPHDALLQERVVKASQYFLTQLQELLEPVFRGAEIAIGNQAVKKQYGNALTSLQQSYAIKTSTLKETLEHGFSVKGYLRAKAVSLLEDEAPKKSAPRRRVSRKTNK